MEYTGSAYVQLRKEEFAKDFLELLRTVPYEKLVVRDLCEHWKISRKTFYRYFSNKEDAMAAVVDYVLLQIGIYSAPVEHESDQPVQNEMIRFFWYWFDNRQFLRILLGNSLIEMLLFRTISNVLSEMDVFQKDFQKMKIHEQESVIAYFAGGVISMLLYWLRNDFSDTPEQMADRLIWLMGNPGKLLKM